MAADGLAGTDPDDLRVDVGRPRREQELDGAERGRPRSRRRRARGWRWPRRAAPWPTERVMPSSARRAARWAGEPARAGSRPMTTTRAQRPSRFRAGPRVARSASRSAGSSAAVRSTTTAPSRPVSGSSSTSVAPAAVEAVTQRGQRGGVGVAADEHRPVDERAPGHLAAQRPPAGAARAWWRASCPGPRRRRPCSRRGAPSQAPSRIATTPWPPAAQIEIRPREPGPFSCEQLGQRGDDAPAGRGERVPGGQRRAVDVELGAVDGAQRRVQAQALLAEVLVLPRGQRREHRRRRTPRGSRRSRSPAATGRCGRAGAAPRRSGPSAGPRRR